MIPAVKAALGLTDAHAQLTFSIALFGMAFATLIYGSLSDRYGRRPVLLSGLALFLFGSAVSAVRARPRNALVLGRLVQAIGAGCALTLVRAIARDAYRAEQLVTAIAYLTMFGTLGPMISPIIGGVLTDTLGWRSVFGFALIAGGAITLTAYLAMYETHPVANRNRSGASVAQSYVALFRRLRFSAFVLTSGFNTGAFMVMASASASLMTELLHRPATEFGLYFLLFPLGFFTGNFISTRIGNRVSSEAMILAGRLAGLCQCVGTGLGAVQRLRGAARILRSGHVHHDGAGPGDALCAGWRDGGNSALRRHRGRRRRLHAELRRGDFLAALRHSRRRHATPDDDDCRAVRVSDPDHRGDPDFAEEVRDDSAAGVAGVIRA